MFGDEHWTNLGVEHCQMLCAIGLSYFDLVLHMTSAMSGLKTSAGHCAQFKSKAIKRDY